MNDIHTEPGAPLVRASDAERDQAAELLRAAFAEGRLTRAELDERLAVAYAAKTRADLSDLTGDLPGDLSGAATAEAMAAGRPLAADLPAVHRGTGASVHLDLCLLLCLLFLFPPAGIAYGIYWIVTACSQCQRPGHEPFPSTVSPSIMSPSTVSPRRPV